jgi:hydrogenase maturation protease
MKKIGVIGIGNPLRRDDGIGIVLLEKLRKIKNQLPDTIDYIDGGTGGMNLLHLIPRFENVVLVDAVNFGGKTGESKIFSMEDVLSKRAVVTLSTHGSDFFQILQLSNRLKEVPNSIVIFGVQPKDTSFGQYLSEELEQLLDILLKDLQSELLLMSTIKNSE